MLSFVPGGDLAYKMANDREVTGGDVAWTAAGILPIGKIAKLGKLASTGTKILGKNSSYINLVSSNRTKHIIAGDVTGGGHAWFGSIKSFSNGAFGRKSMFPVTWNNKKIMHAISEVSVNNQWIQQTGSAGAMFTKSGNPVRFAITGSYNGIKIKVIATHSDIITAFPIR